VPSITATNLAVPETSCPLEFVSPLPMGGREQPSGVEGPGLSCFAGLALSTHDELATGIRGRRPTSSLDRWTG
jgi:hypothetical protein